MSAMRINDRNAFDVELVSAVGDELELFAEELSDDSLTLVAGGNCAQCISSVSSVAGGCVATASSKQ